MSRGPEVRSRITSQRSVVTSADGTEIAFDTRGAGPGVLILSGSVVPPDVYEDLAQALATSFTVHVVHRRGRGASGAQGADYRIDREVEDVEAVLEQTGSTRLFGHSFGGCWHSEQPCARTCRTRSRTCWPMKPPVSVDGSVPSDFMPAFNDALARNKPALAMTVLSRGLQIGGNLDRLPAPAHRVVNAFVLGTIGREIAKNLPTVSAEAGATIALDGPATAYASVRAPALILLGERGPEYFKRSARAIAAHLRNVDVDVMAGLDHNGPMFAADRVAAVAKRFLT